MGLLALPALWAGKDGETVLRIMIDAACSIVPLSAVLAVTPFPPAEEPTPMLKIGRGVPQRGVPAQWLAFEAACRSVQNAERIRTVQSPVGSLTVLHLQMGAGRHRTEIWFASGDRTFPTANHTAFLRAASSLAASGLSSARTEFERARAQRSKDEFLAMLGHELRNPLAPIVTSLRIIQMKNGGQLDRDHQVIERQVGHLSRLVDDLLDITRITRNRVELRKETFGLAQVVREAIEGVSPLIEERRHRVAVQADDEPHVEADRSRIRQVVSNLLINAAKYTPPAGELFVRVARRGEMAEVVVQDNGIGIDAVLLPRVFGLFEQGSTSLDRARGGLGIGLAIVERLVSLHGGTVQAESDGPGRGSRFSVSLPLVDRKQAEPRAAAVGRSEAGSSVVGRGRRVLLVDDNEDALASMELLLVMSGFEVETATDAAIALQKSAAFDADAFVLDIGLPGMDGYQLAEELRRRCGSRASTPCFIALTGYGQVSDHQRAMQAGFHFHMVKPVDGSELIETLTGLPASPR